MAAFNPLESLFQDLSQRLDAPPADTSAYPTLPAASALQTARLSLPDPHRKGSYLAALGASATLKHIHETIVPALTGQGLSSRYFGFVTGGSLPVAAAADNIVTAVDQNVQVHLPEQTIATEVEDVALRMLADVLGLQGSGEYGTSDVWLGRTFTTGATSSNILGLACGRESVVSKRLTGNGEKGVGELGLLAACHAAGIREIQVLTSMGHSSLSKAAGVVGFGRASVKQLPMSADTPWKLDLEAVEKELAQDGVASVIAVSAGEVNTGEFAVDGLAGMQKLRALADKYGAWIHVDGGKVAPVTVAFVLLFLSKLTTHP
jgi:glutamate/tyrosine decarboxylase-like PLP-dependent enzyme